MGLPSAGHKMIKGILAASLILAACGGDVLSTRDTGRSEADKSLTPEADRSEADKSLTPEADRSEADKSLTPEADRSEADTNLDFAERRERVQLVPVPPPPLPRAPEGLSGCDEMNWYRAAVGLPGVFSRLGWRESNCRNEDAVRTWCCHGYWQMYTSLHLRDSRLGPKMIACGVRSHEDLNSDTPEDKWRQACAAKALYDLEGLRPWALP